MKKAITGIILAVLMIGGVVSCSSTCNPPCNMKGEG
jgi:hypothetical protein